MAYDIKPDFVFLNETWSNDEHSDAFLRIPGYEIICRKDRIDTANGIGGGLLLYMKIGLVCGEYVSSEMECFNQCCAVKISLSNCTELVLVLIYRPHNLYSNTNILDEETIKNNSILCNLLVHLPKPSVIIGDLNYSCINWESLSCSTKSKSFFDTVQDCFYTQHVNFPTHVSGTTPDLVLSSSPGLVVGVEEMGRIGASDHSMLLVSVIGQLSTNDTTELVPDWRHADLDIFRAELAGVDWEITMAGLNTLQCWEMFKEKVKEAEEKSVPKKRRRVSNRPIWMKQNIIRIIRKKRRLWKHYKKTKDYDEYISYKRVEKEVQKTVRRAKKTFEKKLAKEAKKNPRAFYSYLNSKTVNKQSVGPLKDDGNIVSDNEQMCDLMNKYFSSVFTNEDVSNIPLLEKMYNGNLALTSVSFTSENVSEKISKLKSTSAPGMDKMYPRLLKEAVEFLCHPLTIIYTRSLEEGVVPDDWRCANITPVFKSGSRFSAGNYRPISLTSIICKLMESIIRDAIVNHLAINNLIRSSQHGFMANKSCLTNLLEYLETLTTLVDMGHNVDVVYLDFAKAFDKVPHQRLLKKLESHGIGGKVLDWISAWLHERKQRVVLNGSASQWADVISGVPQGSVLGPTCFVVFINDIDEVIDIVSTFISKFADDTKCGRTISNDEDRAALQRDIDNLLEWADKWQMDFNALKCKVVHFGRTNPRYSYVMGGYAPGGKVLESVEVQKDIGVMIHQSLKPSFQCAKAAKKANSILGQMARSFHYRDRTTWKNIYMQYVRPHLEVSVQAWSPWLQGDIDVLEAVQKRAVRMISGLNGTSYEEKLSELGLTTLKARRKRGDMIQVWKILHGKDDVVAGTWFRMTSAKHFMGTRQSSDILSISKPKANLEMRHNFFSLRVVNEWNSLPSNVKNSVSLDVFKASHDRLLAKVK